MRLVVNDHDSKTFRIGRRRNGNRSSGGEGKMVRQGEIYRGDSLGEFLTHMALNCRASHVASLYEESYKPSGKKLSWEQSLVLASRTFVVPILAQKYVLGINPETGKKEVDKSKDIGVGYNFPRGGDILEDKLLILIATKIKLLERFNKNLELITRTENIDENYEAALEEFRKISSSISSRPVPTEKDISEKIFMENFESSVRAFKTLPREVKNSFFKHYTRMVKGMMHYLQNHPKTLEELTDYNLHVAGFVGEFLTEDVQIRDGVQLMPTRAHAFGDRLQNGNNIRDVGDDYFGLILSYLSERKVDMGEINDYRTIINNVSNLREIIGDIEKDGLKFRIMWPSCFYENVGIHDFMLDPRLKSLRREALENLYREADKSREGMFNYILSMPTWLTGYTSFCTMPALYCEKTYDIVDNEDSKENEEVFYLRGGVKIGKDEFMNITSFVLDLANKNKNHGEGRIHNFIRSYMFNSGKFSFRNEDYASWAPHYIVTA